MDMTSMASGMGGLGGILGGLFNLFGGGGKNPADVAQGYLGQIPPQLLQLLAPYMNAGQGAMNTLGPEYQKLLSGDVYNRLAGGYQKSPGYQNALKEALGASTNAAAAGGMLGTPWSQEQAQESAQGVASKDFNNYMAAQLGLYGQGLSGLGDLNKLGFNATSDYANSLANTLGSQAQFGYAGQAGRNMARSGGIKDIFGGLGQALPWLFGGR